jgi:hypothetical protein
MEQMEFRHQTQVTPAKVDSALRNLQVEQVALDTHSVAPSMEHLVLLVWAVAAVTRTLEMVGMDLAEAAATTAAEAAAVAVTVAAVAAVQAGQTP